MKVFIVNGNGQYAQMFAQLGHSLVDSVQAADLVCFTGGADVSSSLYGDKSHPYTGSDMVRDRFEKEIFDQAIAAGKPMVGICRGAQFTNVMSGGRMYQHVEGHTRSHAITDLETGETVYVSSTHHQMMMPSEKALLVASSTIGGSREWFDGEVFRKDISKEDIEVVFYEGTQCLCFQPHPEFNGAEYVGMREYFRTLLNRYLKVA